MEARAPPKKPGKKRGKLGDDAQFHSYWTQHSEQPQNTDQSKNGDKTRQRRSTVGLHSGCHIIGTSPREGTIHACVPSHLTGTQWPAIQNKKDKAHVDGKKIYLIQSATPVPQKSIAGDLEVELNHEYEKNHILKIWTQK